MSKQYVQHISSTGPKFPVLNERPSWLKDGRGVSEHEWLVQGISQHLLPKSEYVLCDPPEQWIDVTNECRIKGNGEIWLQCGVGETNVTYFSNHNDKTRIYRLRKVRVDVKHDKMVMVKDAEAFIVEKLEP